MSFHRAPHRNRYLSMRVVLDTKNLFLGVNIGYGFIFGSLRHCTTECDRDKSLLQNESGFFLQMRQFYFRMRQLLSNAWILLLNAIVITKCDVYYKKTRRYRVLNPALDIYWKNR